MHIRVDSNVSDDAYSDDIELQPGPRDPTVLYLQAEHRSTNVWNVGGGDSQRSRVRCKFPALHPRMVPILRNLRFDGVARLAGIIIDWSLVTALVERWRPETHTFHLPTGECTITLQDVSVLLGLRIDGNVITGSTRAEGAEGGWSTLINEMFGSPPGRALNYGRLKLSWLDSVVPEVLPDDADDDELVRYTQAYLLQLLGGVLFTDHQGSQVHCMFIPLLQNFSHCETLSWGSGVLAYLYRELCKSCKIGVEEIAGCVLLVQLWAWTRLPTLAPVPSPPPLDIWGDHKGPYGLRWSGPKSFADVSSHVVCVHRLSLDVLVPLHFIWMPYTDDVLETLDEHCKEGSAIWCYRGPIICFYIVEQHQPDRCVRQFGMVQDIPPPAVVYSKELHNMNLKGKSDVNWGIKHKEHISYWDTRLQHVLVVDNVGVGVTDQYDIWYGDITRPYHTRIGAAGSYMISIFDRISAIARGDVVGGSNSLIDSIANHGRRVLEYQYSRGLFQDFPVDVRRAREETLRGKTKKVGHKGGRGGINAPKRRKLDIDNEAGDHVHEDVHLGDEDHLVEGGGQDFADFVAGGTSTHDLDEVPNVDLSAPCPHPTFDCTDSELLPPQQHRATTIVRPSPSSYVPSFRLLASNDFLTPHEQAPVEDNVEEHPELQTHRATTIQLSQSAYVPTFQLLASNDFLTPPLVEQHDQQSSEEPRRQQQAPTEEFVQEQPPAEGIIEEHPVVEQLQAPIEEQEELAHEAHPMKLRTRNRHPPKYGTDGIKKAPEVKQHYERIRKKHA